MEPLFLIFFNIKEVIINKKTLKSIFMGEVTLKALNTALSCSWSGCFGSPGGQQLPKGTAGAHGERAPAGCGCRPTQAPEHPSMQRQQNSGENGSKQIMVTSAP